MNIKSKIFKLLVFIMLFTVVVTGCGKNKKKDSLENQKVKEVVTRYIESVEQRAEINSLSKPTEDDITEGVYTVEELKEKYVILKEETPVDGWVRITDNKKIIDYSLVVDNYTANKDKNNISIEKGINIKIKPVIIKDKESVK